MKLVRFVCICLSVILGSILAMGQSGRSPLIHQPNAAATFSTNAPTSGLNFAAAVAYGSGAVQAGSVAVADVNGDGKPDLVVANYCVASSSCTSSNGVVGVLLGNGNGTFQAATSYSSGGLYAQSVAVADVNGDGKPDLLVTNDCVSSSNCGNGTVAVLLGNGDGTFQTATTYASGGYEAVSVAVADVNGDGKPDLLVANFCASSSASCAEGVDGVVGVLLGNGDGTFQPATTYASGGVYTGFVTVADVNGDGKLDLLVANECASSCTSNGVVGVLLGNGDGTFQPVTSYATGGSAFSVSVADVNRDGKPDLVVATECGNEGICGHTGVVAVLLGNGDGTFQSATGYNCGSYAYSVAVADVDGDGRLDIVVANGPSDTAGVLLGNGNGTFQPVTSYGSGGLTASFVSVADVNGDGKPDLLMANFCAGTSCANGSAGVLINTTLWPATITLASSPNPSNSGQSVTFAARVTSTIKAKPTGKVAFFDGTKSLGSSTLNANGVAKFSTSTLTAGTHEIRASYKGDANFAAGNSSVLRQVVK